MYDREIDLTYLRPHPTHPSLPHTQTTAGEAPQQPQQHYLATLADDIVKESMRRGSRDNITALVVRLRPAVESGDGGSSSTEASGSVVVGGGKQGRESTDSAGSGSGRRMLFADV